MIEIEKMKRIGFAVATVILLILTLLGGWFVYTFCYVWLDAEEAVASVEQMDNGRVRVNFTDEVDFLTMGRNYIYCEALRYDLPERRRQKEEKDNYYEVILKEGESLWYHGSFTGGEDTLLWGDGEQARDGTTAGNIDNRILYIFTVSLSVGLLLALLCVVLRNYKWAKFIAMAAVLLLCCSASCLFVTNGHMLSEIWGLDLPGKYWLSNKQLVRYISIAGMTLLSFATIVCGATFIKLQIKKVKK